ncbi:actin-related protein 6-like, partial [Antrostomus carolinensis]|uniref:actin-related protein 6-like n=1 Tax=Antrostomus carolinensis TaxID=279965 RepID=UPI0010A982AE
GYLVNWDVQRQVWDYLFGKEMYQVDFVDTNIIITEPYFNFSSIQESMNEILFEEYQFQAVLRVNAGALSAHRYFRDNPSELCCIIVDSGYSFTHIVPYCRSKKKKEAIIRINVGGKLLTNHLKEIISYRQLHVMDETHVINQVKEDVCYVSQDFYKDMDIAKLKGEENTVMVDYVLPDFSTIKKGFCKAGMSDTVVGVYYRPYDQDEEVDEAFYRQLAAAPQLQALVLMGDFNYPGISWNAYTASHSQSRRFLQCTDGNFLMQMVDEPTRRGVLLDLLLTNKEGLIEVVKVESSLGCSNHKMVEFRILCGRNRIPSGITTLVFSRANFGLFK